MELPGMMAKDTKMHRSGLTVPAPLSGQGRVRLSHLKVTQHISLECSPTHQHQPPSSFDPACTQATKHPSCLLVTLTVGVLLVRSTDPAIRRHLEVEANAHVAVESPLSLNAHQISTFPIHTRNLSS